MPTVKDLVQQRTEDTGAGHLTLTPEIGGFQTFSDAFGTGPANTFYYAIRSKLMEEWEVGEGYMLDATTLVRVNILESSNGGAIVTFQPGVKFVVSDLPADIQLQTNAAVSSVNGQTGVVSLDADDIPDDLTAHKFATQAELDQITTNTADIATNAANITTNTDDIATNASDISQLQTDVSGKQDQGPLLDDLNALSPVQGDIFYYDGSDLVTLPPGALNQVLASGGAGANPFWSSAGAVDSVNGQTGTVVLDADDIDDSLTAHKFASQAQLDQIATNTSDIALNTTDISTNSTNISTNALNISTNTSDIADLQNDKQDTDVILDDLSTIAFQQGDILYYNGTNLVRLAPGTAGYFLKTNGPAANPQWDIVAGSGAVDSVNGQTGVVVLDSDDISDTGQTNKWATQAELDQITTNQTNIATNTSDIATNASNISSNTSAIAGKQDQDASLDDIAGLTFAQGDILYHNATSLVNLSPGTAGFVLTTNGAGADPSWSAIPAAPVDSVNGQTGTVVLDADDIDDAATTNKFATQAQLNQIATNTSDIATNASDIMTNATNISTNSTNISNNTAAIAGKQDQDVLLDDIAGLTPAAGDILYYDGANLVNLGVGTDGQVLEVQSGLPSWQSPAAGIDPDKAFEYDPVAQAPINSTTFVAIATLNHTFANTGNHRFLAHITFGFNNNTRNSFFQLFLDGSPISEEFGFETKDTGADIRNVYTFPIYENVSAGAHTLELRARVENVSDSLTVYVASIDTERFD